MKKSGLFLWSAINSFCSFAYITGVAWIMFNGENLFGKTATFWTPVAILLLFVLSATVVGALILGRPIYLYLNGFKKEAVKLLVYTICWLLIFTSIVISAQLVIK